MKLEQLANTPAWEWPEDAGETILDCLRDPGRPADERRLAAELGGDLVVMDDEMAHVLLTVVRSADEPEAVRAQAAIALGPALEEADMAEFDEGDDDVAISEETFHDIRDALRDVYRDAGAPTEVRRRVLEAAVRAPQDWHAGAVRAAWASDDAAWKVTAVFCMQYLPGFDAPILEALGSADPDLHLEAVRAAGARELAAAWPHVDAVLKARDPDRPLLLAAIEAAGTIRPEDAADVLARFAASDDEEIAATAEEAIAMALPLDAEEDDDRF